MSKGYSPMARGLLVAAAFVVVVAGIKSAESILVPFFTFSIYCIDFFTIVGLVEKKEST